MSSQEQTARFLYETALQKLDDFFDCVDAEGLDREGLASAWSEVRKHLRPAWHTVLKDWLFGAFSAGSFMTNSEVMTHEYLVERFDEYWRINLEMAEQGPPPEDDDDIPY